MLKIKKEIFIQGNVPSLKNSKVATSRGVFNSPTVTKYLRNLGIQYFSSSKKYVKEYANSNRPNLFRKAFEDVKWIVPDTQVVIGFHFIRGSRHKFDYNNICQIIQDLMVAHSFIEDDNMDYLVPMPFKVNGNYYSYDKENPGVIIRLYESN